jgi:archaellum component FlaC
MLLAGPGGSTYRDDMTTDPSLNRRVARLENDVDSIYDLIAEIKTTQDKHTERFDGIDQRLDGMDQRFDGIDQRLDGIDQRLDGMDLRFDGVETTLVEVLRRLPVPS